MAHFLTLVLVDGSGMNPVRRAHERMMPYFDRDMETPESMCDGFVVGGRYDGVIWGKEQHYNLTPEQHQARYGLDVVKPEDNVRPVAELQPGLVPYAIVTDDGHWHDREGKSDEQWTAEVESILRAHPHCLVVAIDCHC